MTGSEEDFANSESSSRLFSRSHRGNYLQHFICCPECCLSQCAGVGHRHEKSIFRPLRCCNGREEVVRAELRAMSWQEPAGHWTCAGARHCRGPQCETGRVVLVCHQWQTIVGNAGLAEPSEKSAVGNRKLPAIQPWRKSSVQIADQISSCPSSKHLHHC